GNAYSLFSPFPTHQNQTSMDTDGDRHQEKQEIHDESSSSIR
ncbi:MAG: hypothetical protein JWL77_625, partial [Chthonomonadaceae bacterium]|nr:hypothetical protein [Chthonomonadaceae bacterium]